MRAARTIVWALRVAWAGLALAAGPAFDAALADRSGSVRAVAAVGLWVGWAAGLLATLVPTTVALTTIRLLAPGAVAASIAAWIGGASAGWGAVAVGGALVAVLLAFSAEIGRAFVQGSAYGDESRFPLRPPGALVPLLPVVWATGAAGAVAGPLLLAARQWVAGGAALVVGLPLAAALARRFHRLARRWVVVVPAGFVIHDAMALAETVLFHRAQVEAVTLARAATVATDLTIRAVGLALELRVVEPAIVTLAADRRDRRGRPVAVAAVLVSPSRPGAVLEECARRRLPVRA